MLAQLKLNPSSALVLMAWTIAPSSAAAQVLKQEMQTKPLPPIWEETVIEERPDFPAFAPLASNLNNFEFTIGDRPGDAIEGQWNGSRPDGHAPIGVMGDHTHSAGEFMFSYRYMVMNMDGNRDDTDDLDPEDVLADFPVTPIDMTMEMHMFGAMYAPTGDLTLMAMLPYVAMEMDHITRSGVEFTTESSGFGDLPLSGLYNILDRDRQRLHLNLGVSIPTGSTNQKDDTPAGEDSILPYPMQIGSGTFDLLPGITYSNQSDRGSWGAQVLGTLRLGENSGNYTLGDRLQTSLWIARNWTDSFSTSLRLKGSTWGDIDGADPRLNPRMVPNADPSLRNGTRLDLGLGINLYAPEGDLQGARFALEFELPLYQDLDGPQLETDWMVTMGIQAVF